MDYKNRTILIGCGAAGAIAGIFNSPVTGVIFSSEVILAGLGFASFIPLLIAAVCGSLVSLMLLGDDVLFSLNSKIHSLPQIHHTIFYWAFYAV
jgi:CIC family chloride channel protein